MSDLEQSSARVATYLRACGVGRGDQVALMLPDVPEFAVLHRGILRVGASAVTLDPRLGAADVAHRLAGVPCAGIFAWHGCAEQAALGARDVGTPCVVIEPLRFSAALDTYDFAVS
jgi:long-chain acyl-CoA synthetase